MSILFSFPERVKPFGWMKIYALAKLIAVKLSTILHCVLRVILKYVSWKSTVSLEYKSVHQPTPGACPCRISDNIFLLMRQKFRNFFGDKTKTFSTMVCFLFCNKLPRQRNMVTVEEGDIYVDIWDICITILVGFLWGFFLNNFLIG